MLQVPCLPMTADTWNEHMEKQLSPLSFFNVKYGTEWKEGKVECPSCHLIVFMNKFPHPTGFKVRPGSDMKCESLGQLAFCEGGP